MVGFSGKIMKVFKKNRKGNFLLLFLVLVVGFAGSVAGNAGKSTILTAERTHEQIIIDGFAYESSWEGARILSIPVYDGKIGNVEVDIQALYDEEYIYMFITWPDKSQSDALLWFYNGSAWIPPISSEQDIFTIFFNIDDSVEGFGIAGCAISCHADRMRTNSPEERIDMWKWLSAFDNGAGYMSDRFLDNTLVIGGKMKLGYSTTESNVTWQAHKLDSAQEGYISERKNARLSKNGNFLGPQFYEPGAVGIDALYLTLDEIGRGEAVELADLDRLNDGGKIPLNFTVPAYIQERPLGSAGDIDAVGVHMDGSWHLELKRKLATKNPDDVQFDPSRTYRFSISVNDDARGSANTGIGHGHSISLVAKTLEFGGKGSAEVVQLALVRDYLVTAKAYIARGESGLALSTISDALVVFNDLRNPMAELDPELFIHLRNGFVESRRNPSVENIDSLSENVNLALLTFQGKRRPAEASLSLKILVLWGRIGIYVFLTLAVIAVYPIYRMIRIIKKPEFRNLGLFMLLVISPIFLEGIGRLGALLHIPVLQHFSFTTSEYVTLLWAAGMFIALYIGRIGFNEIDNALKSMELTSKELEKKMVELQEARNELETKVEERTVDLKSKVEELEKWQRLTTGREIKMAELKREVGELKKRLQKYEG